MTNDFFEFCQKVSFISYIRNVRMVHGQCTNGTWAMYEWYICLVSNRNGLFTPSNYASHNRNYTLYGSLDN